MKVFVFEIEDGFEFVQVAESDRYALLDELIDGTLRAATWAPVPVKIVGRERAYGALRHSDAPWLGSNVLILRPRAAAALSPLLACHGELLPLSCGQAELVVFNARCVVDALDEAESIVRRFSTRRIMWIQKHAFRLEVIQALQIFKITSLQPSPIFVGEEFVERWNAAGLKGLEFRQVWEG